MSCPFWMEEKLKETITQLGEFGEKNALLKVCDQLWERDCRLQPTDFKKYSSDWLVLAKAFKDGGHSPSNAVKEILQKVIVSTTHPADNNRDVSWFIMCSNLKIKTFPWRFLICLCIGP